MIDIRAPDSTLELAVAQVRALLQRLRQGAMTQVDFDRSAAQRERWNLEGSLDPRHRVVELFRRPTQEGDAPSLPRTPALSLESWRAWAAAVFKDEKLVVVMAHPKR